ncbi:MAG: PilN domain-containing protein [Lysobacteraceae bacterium]|nr:PilN domain-containing protein [Xanthomonadaceae bacterium]
MSIRRISLKHVFATALILASGLAIAATDTAPVSESANADSAESPPAAAAAHPLLKSIDEGGAVPKGVHVEQFEMQSAGDQHVTLSGVSQTAEDIGVLAVQLEESGWLSDVEITTLTRRSANRSYPWKFSMEAQVSMDGSEQLSAR